jgi:AcrR family transcriptional regulator
MKQSPKSTVKAARLGILQVAERLFLQIGFEKTSIADIARELRMSSANIYRFFASKAAINEAVARRLLSEVEVVVEELAKRSAPAGARLRASIAAIEKNNAQRFLDNVEDCDLAAMLVRSACLRFCHPRLMVECAQDPEPTIDQMVDFCLAGIKRDAPEAKLDAQISIHPPMPPQSLAAAS